MIKSRRNYSFSKAAEFLTGTIAETLTDMARYQNESIQRGISTQTDIKGAKFAKLKPSTIEIRNRRGQGFTPLDRMKGERQKKLRNTKTIPAKPSNLTSQILMLTKYGVYHNEGVPESGGMIEGKKIPKREWFGITKEMQRGGSQYEKYVRMTLAKIVSSVNK